MLIIKAEKQTYFLNDKIRIIFSFKNISGKEVKFIPLPYGYMYHKNWISIFDINNRLMKGCSLEKSKMKPFGREAIIVLGPQQEYFCDLIGTILKYKEISIDFSNGSELLLKSGYGQYTLKVKLVLPFDYYYESGKRVKDEGLWRGTLISNKISIEINPY